MTVVGAMLPHVVDSDHDRWREHAACRDSDASLFFPAGSTGAAIEQIEAAKAVCATCPVRDDCLRFALETNQEDGVWGGRDEIERRRLRRGWREGHRPARRPVTV